MTEITSIRVDYKFVDGWHVFSSEQIAGLYVASQDPERAYNDVGTSIEKLLKLNEGIECSVTPELSFPEYVEAQRARKVPAPKLGKASASQPKSLSSQRYAVSACA